MFDGSKVDESKILPFVNAGFVGVQEHPTLPLRIYNYTARCQYERVWNDVTRFCRGLIVDHNGKLVARPMEKFFNDGEHAPEEIPWHLPHVVTEKLDGSLGILFHYGHEWHWATRGSFTSPQSELARQMDRISRGQLIPGYTYLFEIIHPTNRIVVDYGRRAELVLLTMLRNCDGEEFHDAGLVVPRVRTLPPTSSFSDLRSLIRDDEEGYVVRFDNGFRVKVKGAKYMELHRLMSGVSSRSIWECLSAGKSLDSILDVLPDEWCGWVKNEASVLTVAYAVQESAVEAAVATVRNMPTRKEQALVLQSLPVNRSAAFAMLDGKPHQPIIWRSLYPDHRVPTAAQLLV